MVVSKRFSLKKEDLKSWLKNALIFLSPALLIFLASLKDLVPVDWGGAVIVLWALNETVALFKKWLEINRYK